MNRHGRHAPREVLKRDLSPLRRHGLRALGWGASTVSLLMAGAPNGPADWSARGAVEWFGTLTASAVSFVLLLTFCSAARRKTTAGLPVCAAVAGWTVCLKSFLEII